MRTQESCLGHVDTTGWARTQARNQRPIETPMYDEGVEYAPQAPEERMHAMQVAQRKFLQNFVTVETGNDAA